MSDAVKHISFALTTPQFRNRTKTVTRRLGWKNLKPYTHLMGVEKCQGLKKGEKVKKLGEILVRVVHREQLSRMVDDQEYGKRECRREGFPHLNPLQFVQMFCLHNKCKPHDIVTRIKYDYMETATGEGARR